MAAGRRHRPRRELPGCSAHAPAIGVLDLVREGSHHGRARFRPALAAGRLRHRRGARGPDRPRRRGERGVPPRRGAGSGPGPAGSLLPNVRLVQRSRRQRVAAAGDHDTASGPGVGGLTMEIASLAGLLQETAEHHGSFEAVAPPHDWWDWYAAYMSARQSGSTPEEASKAAGRYMADVKHVVVTP